MYLHLSDKTLTCIYFTYEYIKKRKEMRPHNANKLRYYITYLTFYDSKSAAQLQLQDINKL